MDFMFKMYLFSVVAGPPIMFFLLKALNKRFWSLDNRKFLWLFMTVVYIQMVVSAVNLYFGLEAYGL